MSSVKQDTLVDNNQGYKKVLEKYSKATLTSFQSS